MSRIIAFIDESADVGPPAVQALAGFAAFESDWNRVEEEGRALLARYGLDRLHAAELFRSKGAHRGWTDEARVELCADVVTLTQRHPVCGYVIGIDPHRHHERKADTGLSASQSPLGCCFEILNDQLVKAWGDQPGWRLCYRWEMGAKVEAEAQQALETIREEHGLGEFIEGITFVPKGACIGVQLADFLVYLGRRQAQARLSGGAEPDRYWPILEQLLGKVGRVFIATDMW